MAFRNWAGLPMSSSMPFSGQLVSARRSSRRRDVGQAEFWPSSSRVSAEKVLMRLS